MWAAQYPSQGNKFCLYLTIRCKGKRRFRVIAEDADHPNSKYAEREITVEGERKIYLSFPLSPETLVLSVADVNNRNSKDFTVDVREEELKTYNIWLDQADTKFLKLASDFSQICGYSPASPKGRNFTSKNGEFVIRFFDVIKDKAGKPMNTPARVGHKSGRIEVSKMKFDRYTVPMRMMILLHEYSHKYKNPKIGLEISNEIGADVNGLYIYLGLGFSKIDAICVFAKVFLKAQTQGNIKRMRKIMDYITKFENGDYAQKNF